MKWAAGFLLVLLLSACSTLPVDVFQVRAGTSIEEMRAGAKRAPDKVTHFVKDERAWEVWTYSKDGITLTFVDGVITEWHN